MKKAPAVGSFVWVVCRSDDRATGAVIFKKVKVRSVEVPFGDIDPATALADFQGIYDAKGGYYNFDDVFTTEAPARRKAAAEIRLAIRWMEKRIRDNNRALATMKGRLERVEKAEK